jgi:hypothetical protein
MLGAEGVWMGTRFVASAHDLQAAHARGAGGLCKLSGPYADELGNDFPTRVEGTRRKHHRGPLALKLYDKQSLGLRLETTVNEVWFFQHHRTGTIAPARPTPRSRPCARRSRAWHPCARCCSPPTGALWPSSLT